MNTDQQKQIDKMPETYRELFTRVYTLGDRVHPTDAIMAQCLQCVGYEKKEVTKCTSRICPLFHFRPFQKNQ